MQLGLLQVVPLKTKSMYPGGPQAYLCHVFSFMMTWDQESFIGIKSPSELIPL